MQKLIECYVIFTFETDCFITCYFILPHIFNDICLQKKNGLYIFKYFNGLELEKGIQNGINCCRFVARVVFR